MARQNELPVALIAAIRRGDLPAACVELAVGLSRADEACAANIWGVLEREARILRPNTRQHVAIIRWILSLLWTKNPISGDACESGEPPVGQQALDWRLGPSG